MPEYYLKQWTWLTDEALDFSYWKIPDSDGCIDLRALSQRQPGPDPVGFALAKLPSIISDRNAIHLGSSLDEIISLSLKATLKQELNLDDSILAGNLREVIWELLTQHPDPTGAVRWKPLIPKQNLVREILLGRGRPIKSLRQQPNQSTEWDFIRKVAQKDYRTIREEVSAGKSPPEHHRKFLGNLVRKYKLPTRDLIPLDLPDELALRPETLRVDDFNRSDNTDISASAPFSWDEVVNDWEIVSNQLKAVGPDSSPFNSFARATGGTLSSDDHYAEIEHRTSTQINQGAMARYESGANTSYVAIFRGTPTDDWEIFENTTGTLTSIAVNTTASLSNGDVIRCECNGSTIRLLVNGTQQVTVTDTSHTGQIRGGVLGNRKSGNTIQDNYEAQDLVVSGTIADGLGMGIIPFPR